MANPLSAAAAAALAQSALDHEMHTICDIVAELVRARVPVTGHPHFWQRVAETLAEKHGVTRGAVSIRKEYEKVRAWAVANRTGSDGDERKWVKKCLRQASRQQAGVDRDGGPAGAQEEGDEEEIEEGGEGGGGPSAFDNMKLALPAAPPAQQQQQQQPPPAGGNFTLALPDRTKET